MDEGDLDLSNPEAFSGPSMGEDLPSSCSMDSFFDEILKDTHHHSCTHTHTCNPPGPDLSHTHTCFHVHTKILSAPADETAESAEKSSSKKRPSGNREAVRKYREKKKARAASLEDEVIQLRALNQQLLKKLQGQAALEAEVARLRCLLVDLRGRIEGEIGSFPYQRPLKGGSDLVSNVTQANFMGAHVLNSCDFRCDDEVYCLHPGMQGKNMGERGVVNNQEFGVCEIGNIQCMGSSASGSSDFVGCGRGNVMPVGCSSNIDKIEGAHATTEG
ncbi:basic leucine zipper 23 [Elaeis guineensis]|uniref:Basic leucine zipper 19 n=1 Tax=Elaeis guineensis var. tenera TaxID=51953 RepID=A0A6I9RZE0_ELAGV|nr:basic leucine zipper 19 [Elaeis guineensis]